MKKFLHILPIIAFMFVTSNVLAAPYTADDFVITVKTDNPGVSNDNQFTIPTTGLGYHYSVDCSYNGTNVVYDTTNHSGDYTCDYGPNSGTYTIVIHGTFPQIYFNNGGDRQKILTIEQWGTGTWRSMEDAFFGCNNLKLNAQDTPNLSLATSMYEMFQNAINIGEGTGNWTWDTSHITNMESLFLSNSGSSFNADITSWDVSNVINMKNIFFNTSFDRDISSWDVHMVEDFSGMFLRTPFNQNISNWNTANATRTSWMFYKNHDFNQDISNWDVSNVTDMSYMFDEATSFDQNLGNWNVSNVVSMDNIFTNAGLSTKNYDKLLIGWNALSTLKDNVQFDAGNSIWCSATADTARSNIINTHNWTFNGDIRGNGCPAPTISEVTPIVTPSSNPTPSYIFNSDEAGEIIYGGSCSSATTNAIVGDNTIVLNELTTGTYSDCTVKVRDSAGNDSNVLNIPEFVVDVTPPTLKEITPIKTPTSDRTPEYIFSSDEAGTITYSGDCVGSLTTVVVGFNDPFFKMFPDGTFPNCKITVTDSLGNVSEPLNVSEFTIFSEKTPMFRLYNRRTGAQLYTRGEADRDKIRKKFSDFEFTDGAPAFYASLTEQPGLTPIYRLYSRKTGAQLYTRGEVDRDKILKKWPDDFTFTDGVPAFYASLTDDGSTPIYRLYNKKTGMQLYTRGDADKDKILKKWPDDFTFTDGAPAFYASLTN